MSTEYRVSTSGGDQRRDDPDPISLGVAIFASLFGGLAYLETRRQGRRQDELAESRLQSRVAAASRSVNELDYVLSDFAIALEEFGLYGDSVRPGSVALATTREEKRHIRSLSNRARQVARNMEKSFDQLSDELGRSYRGTAKSVSEGLGELLSTWPDSYGDLLERGQHAVSLYRQLIEEVSSEL